MKKYEVMYIVKPAEEEAVEAVVNVAWRSNSKTSTKGFTS